MKSGQEYQVIVEARCEMERYSNLACPRLGSLGQSCLDNPAQALKFCHFFLLLSLSMISCTFTYYYTSLLVNF
jgi:hypothetical protein